MTHNVCIHDIAHQNQSHNNFQFSDKDILQAMMGNTSHDLMKNNTTFSRNDFYFWFNVEYLELILFFTNKLNSAKNMIFLCQSLKIFRLCFSCPQTLQTICDNMNI